jgi:adenosine deaminase
MREHGLLLTINTDDSAMEDLDLGAEYRNVSNAFGLDVEAMRAFAREGIESTWLDESERRALRAEFDAAVV